MMTEIFVFLDLKIYVINVNLFSLLILNIDFRYKIGLGQPWTTLSILVWRSES